jgi:carbamoyltransferase
VILAEQENAVKQNVVLGLNCSHDAAAAIAVNGVLVAAISEERLSKNKHFDGFPENAIDYCIKETGFHKASLVIDRVVINQIPLVGFERSVLDHFRAGAVQGLIVNPSHHYLHACYAEMLTHRRPVVVLVVDGSGYSYAEHKRRASPLLGPEPRNVDAWESLSAYHVAEDGTTSLLMKDWGEWRDLKTLSFPSLGHMYGCAAHHIFGSWIHAGKLMGLAPFGDAEAVGGGPIVTLTAEGVEVDTDWITHIPKIPFSPHFEDVPAARNLAARIQSELERAMMHLCTTLHRRTGCETICVTGGVALNSVFNGRLAMDGPFNHVVVAPASSDAGTAIGAAAYGCKELTGKRLQFRDDPEFLGHNYTPGEISAVIEGAPNVVVRKHSGWLDLAVQDLMEQKIVGLFEGRAEFGPRALGHRSILADPRGSNMKDRINGRVKFRESFRPYAAAILEEHCCNWFEHSGITS